jgi:hypothetical protein
MALQSEPTRSSWAATLIANEYNQAAVSFAPTAFHRDVVPIEATNPEIMLAAISGGGDNPPVPPHVQLASDGGYTTVGPSSTDGPRPTIILVVGSMDPIANSDVEDVGPMASEALPSVQSISVEDFIAGLKLPLEKPLIQSPPRLRVSRVRVESLVPRRNDRLATKSVYHDLNSEKQAKRVMLNKWQPSASAPLSVSTTPDATITTQFQETFQESLPSSKRAAMQELFPMASARGRRAATQESWARVRSTS